MNYRVSEKKGEAVRVGLRDLGANRYEVEMDGETFEVDAVRSGPTIYSVIENGRQCEVMVDEKGAHGFSVLIRGRLFQLEAQDERTVLLASAAAAVPTGPERVEADMPGKVVKIAVAVGEEVGEGQGVVVVEAMKMENEIASPIAGVVSELGVSEGDAVEAGTLLFVVEPPAPQA